MAERSRWAPGAHALACAARVVSAVASHGRSTEDAFREVENTSDRAAIRAISLGTLRWLLRLQPALDSLLSRPNALMREIRALLAVAAHQIEYSRNVPEVTVNAAVDATRLLSQPRASALVNAVLRRFLAERTSIFERLDRSLAIRTAHPDWLVEALSRAWPGQVESLLAGSNEHPPLVVRVDVSRVSLRDYLSNASTLGVAARALEWAPAAVQFDRPMTVADVPGFSEGLVSIQDAGAQLAAPLLDARPGMRVLDACAAPGGKTGHLLEHTPGLENLIAVDVSPERVGLIRENLTRLHRTAELVTADVRARDFWDGRPFDRILIDAPCSSTGVIRRHPDIKLLRRASDIPSFAATQLELLRSGFAMLAAGGRLLYATCSLLAEENEDVVAALLAEEPLAAAGAMPAAAALAPGAIQRAFGVQLLTGGQAGTDGFYYACLEKTTSGT